MYMKVKKTINIWVDSNCVQVVGFGTQWDGRKHRHPVALEVPLHVCVKLHSSRILIITQQPPHSAHFSHLTAGVEGQTVMLLTKGNHPVP